MSSDDWYWLHEGLEWVVAIWIILFLFVTCPVWAIPYTLYRKKVDRDGD